MSRRTRTLEEHILRKGVLAEIARANDGYQPHKSASDALALAVGSVLVIVFVTAVIIFTTWSLSQ